MFKKLLKQHPHNSLSQPFQKEFHSAILPIALSFFK